MPKGEMLNHPSHTPYSNKDSNRFSRWMSGSIRAKCYGFSLTKDYQQFRVTEIISHNA
jgi:hypothetical protein